MRLIRYLLVLLVLYASVVVAFESLIGYVQPQQEGRTIVLTTYDEDANAHERVVTLLTSQEKWYVGVNHWPRAWWRRTLENPNVLVTKDGVTEPYTATTVEGAEHDQVAADNPMPIHMRALMGFPPRYFVRLDPQTE